MLLPKKHGQRQTYLGTLTSHIDLDKNQDFYNKNTDIGVNFKPSEMEAFKEAKLEASVDIDRIQEELKKRKAVQAAIMRYS